MVEEKCVNSALSSGKENHLKSDIVEISTATPKDPLQKVMSHFGKWHFFIFILLSLAKFPAAWHQMSIIFLAPPPEFQCIDPSIEKCSTNCQAHEFNRTVFEETIITDWDLVCNQDGFAEASQSLSMFGILVGSLLFGWLADKFGRRRPLVIAIFLQVTSGIFTAFTPWFLLFCLLRFITTVATGGILVITFVLLMELMGERCRETISILYHVPFQLGYVILPVFSWLFPHWRHLQLFCSLLSVILITFYWWVPESPRWLLTAGRVEEAANILTNVSKSNGLSTSNIRNDLNDFVNNRSSSAISTHHGRFTDLFRTPNMRKKTLCICFSWFACGLSYFGVAQYIGQSKGNIFKNVFLSGCIGIIGNFLPLLLMGPIGRRNTLVLTTFTAGVCMILVAVFPSWQVELASVALVGISSGFCTVYLYSGELFPTVVRNVGVGLGSVLARIGPMLAPFIIRLNVFAYYLPPIFLGIVPMISALFLLLLPETRGKPLPETIEEGEIVEKKS